MDQKNITINENLEEEEEEAYEKKFTNESSFYSFSG
jgi:hypothetical protein